mgnify:FL=1
MVFRVWAPHATAISVVGDFNSWKPGSHPMRKVDGDSVWELFIPGMKEYDVYKYCVTTAREIWSIRPTPTAFHAETRPSNGSKVYDISGFAWHDEAWQAAQKKADVINGPMNIYEMHAGSWKQKEGGLPYITPSWPTSSSRTSPRWATPTWSCCPSWSTPSMAAGAIR